eukprot:gene3141-5457_t
MSFSHWNHYGYYTTLISTLLTKPLFIFSDSSYSSFLVILIITFVYINFNVIIFIWVIQKEDLSTEFFLKLTATKLFVTTHLFFVPVLNIFLSAFECNYTTGDHLYFKGRDCVVFPNDLAMTVSTFGMFSLIGISFYSQFYVLDRLVVGNFFSSSDGRFFVMIMGYQVCITFLNVIPMKFVCLILAILLSFFMIFWVLRFLPFYSHFVNFCYGITFCINVGFSMTNIVSNYSHMSDYSLLYLFSILPLNSIFTLLFFVRLYLLSYSIKGIEQVSSKTKKHFCSYFFTSAVDTDVQARFAHTLGEHTKAEMIYKNGIKMNPYSSRYKIFYILYLLENEKLDHEYLKKLNNLTRELKSKKKGCKIELHDTKYLIQVCSQKRLELSLKHNIGPSNSLTVLSLRRAKKSKKNYLYWSWEFWKIIESGNFAYYKLMAILSSMEHYEKKCDSIYESLLLDYPKNISVLRAYGEYLETVKNDFRRATGMFEEANKLEDSHTDFGVKEVDYSFIDLIKRKWNRKHEEKVEKVVELMEEIGSTDNSADETTEEKLEVPSALLLQNFKKFQKVQNDSDSDETASELPTDETSTLIKTQEDAQMNLLFEEMEGTTKSLTKTEKNYYEYSKKSISNELPTAFWIFSSILSLLFLIFLLIISVSYFSMNTKLNDIKNLTPTLNSAGKCRLDSISLAYYSRMLEVHPKNTTNFREKMIKHNHHFTEITTLLYEQTLRKSLVYPLWNNQKLLTLKHLTLPPENVNLFDAHYLMLSATKKLLNLTQYQKPDDDAFYFVNMNGLNTYVNGYTKLIEAVKMDKAHEHQSLFLFFGILFIIFIIFSLILLIFIPSLYWIEKNNLKLFYEGKKEEITRILEKYKKMFERSQENPDEKEVVKYKTPVLVILIRNSICILLFGILLLTAFLILFLITQSIFFETVQNVDFSGRRRYLTLAIKLRTLEFSANNTFYTPEENKKIIREYLITLLEYDQGLKKGNEKYDLKGSDGRKRELDELYYHSRCRKPKTDLQDDNFNCMSLTKLTENLEININRILSGNLTMLNETMEIIDTMLPLWEEAVFWYSKQYSSLVEALSTFNQIVYIMGISLFIFLSFFLMSFAPFSLKNQILRTKSMLLDFSIQQIFSSKDIEKHIHGTNINKSYDLGTRYHRLLNKHIDTIIEFSDSLLIDYANSSASSFLNLPFGVLVGYNLDKIFKQSTMTDIENFMKSDEMKYSAEVVLAPPLNKKIKLLIMKLPSGHLNEYLAIMHDLTKIENQKKMIDQVVGKSKEIYFNTFPKEIAERKMENPDEFIGQYYDDSTILICDILNYDELFQKFKEHDFFTLMNEIHEIYVNLTEKHKIELLKTGSTFIVVSGVPRVYVDHAFVLLDFAIELKDIIDQFSDKYGEEIEMRYGINSGPIIGGVIGTKKFCFDIFGETLKETFLLKNACIPSTSSNIMVSETTRDITNFSEEFVCNFFIGSINLMIFDEVLCINVGGKLFECKKQTLTKYKKSIFPLLLQYQEHFKDKKELIFIDRPPNIFEYILNHLRTNREYIYENKIFSHEKLRSELDFYGLNNHLKIMKKTMKQEGSNPIPEKKKIIFLSFISNFNYFHIEEFILGSTWTLLVVFWLLKTIYLIGGIIPVERMYIIFWPIYFMFFEALILTFIHMIKDIIQFKSGYSYFVNFSVIIILWIYVYLSFTNTYNYINNLTFNSWFWYLSIPISIDLLFCLYSINKMVRINGILDIFSTMESLLIHFGPINILMNLVSLTLYLDGYGISNFWIKIPASIHSLFGSLFSFKTAHECVDWQGKLIFSLIGVFLILSSWTLIGLYLELNAIYSFGPLDLWFFFSIFIELINFDGEFVISAFYTL